MRNMHFYEKPTGDFSGLWLFAYLNVTLEWFLLARFIYLFQFTVRMTYSDDYRQVWERYFDHYREWNSCGRPAHQVYLRTNDVELEGVFEPINIHNPISIFVFFRDVPAEVYHGCLLEDAILAALHESGFSSFAVKDAMKQFPEEHERLLEIMERARKPRRLFRTRPRAQYFTFSAANQRLGVAKCPSLDVDVVGVERTVSFLETGRAEGVLRSSWFPEGYFGNHPVAELGFPCDNFIVAASSAPAYLVKR